MRGRSPWLDLAGNLYYPVAIIVSAALLLMALGVFLRLAPGEVAEVDAAVAQMQPGPAKAPAIAAACGVC